MASAKNAVIAGDYDGGSISSFLGSVSISYKGISTEINKNTVEEVSIPDMPPLPDISSDDTTSIPVIPIAEPSTDDNFTVSTTDNNEPASSIETSAETTQESETN